MDNRIRTLTLDNGSSIGISAIKITSIPHLSILTNELPWQASNSRINEEYKEEICNLLYEIWQHYRIRLIDNKKEQNDSLELLWLTTPVENQPYRANIDLYIIIRCCQQGEYDAKTTATALLNLCESTFALSKFTFESVDCLEIINAFSNVDCRMPHAIVKAERVDVMNTTILQASYAVDVIKPTKSDLSLIVNTLLNHPNCALSFQIMPTFFSQDETKEIISKAQTLSMLINGVNVQGVGNVKVETAKRSSDTYNYYAQNNDQFLFLSNIIIYGERDSNTEICAKFLGQINVGQSPAATFDIKPLPAINMVGDFNLMPWKIYSFLMNNGRNSQVWNSGYVSQANIRMPFLMTGEEVSEFFRLPIANEKIGAGFTVNESGSTSKTYAKGILNACQLPFGKLKSSGKDDTIGLQLNDLSKHMLIVGTPGSGKTNFSVGLLRTLWLKYKIPFLVIEPAKNEYRALVQNIPELQVFTPGKNDISPFVFNPFIPPENVKLQAYKSTLKTAFAAGVTMTSPLDKIFEDTIENCYSDNLWLNSYTKADKGRSFNISDFIKCFQKTFEAIGYSGDAANIGRAGIVRLQGLVRLFDNYHSIPIEDLLTRPTVIELAAIENSDEKALYIALILLSILAYVNANYVGEGKVLNNFILVEEAHVLLDSESHGGEGAANPSAIAQGLVKRMLAEIRSYGVSVAIADQSPRKVGTDIVALTDIKLAFRLVESEDREILANSISMTDQQKARLAKLRPGEAFFFFNKMLEPEEIVTPENRESAGYRISLSDREIAELSTYWKHRSQLLKPYPECIKKVLKNNVVTAVSEYPCKDSCSNSNRMLAAEVGKRIVKSYDPTMSNEEIMNSIRKVWPSVISKHLNGEQVTPRLIDCVWVHIRRTLRYRIIPKTHVKPDIRKN